MALFANVKVIDPEQVYVSEEAEAALKRSYLTAPYLLDKYGKHYKENIVAAATSGKPKGMKYINSEANEYVHATDDGIHIVVVGKCMNWMGRRHARFTSHVAPKRSW